MVEVQEFEQISLLYPAIPAKDEGRIERFCLPSEGKVRDWSEKHPDAECGKTKYTIKCKEESRCDYPVDLVPWDCGRLECPVCYPRALKRASNKARDHIWNTLLEVKEAVPQIGWIISSVIISAPPEIWHMEYDDLKKRFRKSLKKLGTENVAAIMHLWRFREIATGEEIEPNSVAWRRYKRNPSAFERVKQPHWHCFVIGRMAASSFYFKKTGFVYKKKANGRTGYSLTKKDVFRITYYALSHAAISLTQKRQYVSYYGLFNSLQVVEEIPEYQEVICPKCKQPRVKRAEFHFWIAGVDIYGLEEPYSRKRVRRKWEFRKNWQRWLGVGRLGYPTESVTQ